MTRVELSDVTYTYPHATAPTLTGLSCSFETGTVYGIVGSNGAGKTTLCNLVRGLIPHFFDGDLQGQVTIDGVDVRDWDPAALSVLIGYIFQNPFTQISGIRETVFEEIALGLEYLGYAKEQMIERVLDIVALFDLDALVQRNPASLSGGQRQRVAFAAILAMDSEILVIDEPTSQLDPESTREIFAVLGALKETGKTILLVEQRVDLLAEHADEIVVLDSGTVIASGATADTFSRPGLGARGVPVPQVTALAHDLAGTPYSPATAWVTRQQAADDIRRAVAG